MFYCYDLWLFMYIPCMQVYEKNKQTMITDVSNQKHTRSYELLVTLHNNNIITKLNNDHSHYYTMSSIVHERGKVRII